MLLLTIKALFTERDGVCSTAVKIWLEYVINSCFYTVMCVVAFNENVIWQTSFFSSIVEPGTVVKNAEDEKDAIKHKLSVKFFFKEMHQKETHN